MDSSNITFFLDVFLTAVKHNYFRNILNPMVYYLRLIVPITYILKTPLHPDINNQ